jgi:hypothetical protein
MSAWGRIGAFAMVLLGTYGTAYALGERLPGHSHSGTHSGHVHAAPSLAPPAFESNGYRLVTDGVVGDTATFHLESADGTTVTSFDVAHGALLHTIVIRPDLSGFQHIHPDIAADGRWQVVLDQPGRWHVVFESTPSGSSSSVVVAANFDDEQVVEPTPLPAPDDEVEVHGLRVTRTGLTFSVVNTDGSQSLDLEPYLGQPAHLVAIREGDLAYVHLHPQMDMVGGFMFGTDLPQAGTYRVFLQFGHAGEVLTVPFTVVQS